MATKVLRGLKRDHEVRNIFFYYFYHNNINNYYYRFLKLI